MLFFCASIILFNPFVFVFFFFCLLEFVSRALPPQLFRHIRVLYTSIKFTDVIATAAELLLIGADSQSRRLPLQPIRRYSAIRCTLILKDEFSLIEIAQNIAPHSFSNASSVPPERVSCLACN